MRRDGVSLLVILAVISCTSNTLLAGVYSGGDGSADNPYRISSVLDWYELTASYWDWNQQFILTENLDFEGAALSPVGTQVYSFRGIFNGQNHCLRNLMINKPNSNGVGPFGFVDSGQILNMGVENVNVTGSNSVGGLVGSNNLH